MSSMQIDKQEGASKASSSGLEFKLHPLVLINISDHTTRTRANTGDATGQVYGIILGSQVGRTVDISNSFEIKMDNTGAIDMAFLALKQEQYKQVFPKLDVVGWYATGSELTSQLMAMHAMISTINESPVLMLLDATIDHTRKDLPVMLYESELHVSDGESSTRFVKAAYAVETSDAERIGVDQVAKLSASGRATGSEQLVSHLQGLHQAIKMLTQRVKLVVALVHKMQSGEVPANPALLRRCSSLLSALPALDNPQFSKEYLMEYNDALLSVLLSSMTKGLATCSEVADVCVLAFDKSASRRRQM